MSEEVQAQLELHGVFVPTSAAEYVGELTATRVVNIRQEACDIYIGRPHRKWRGSKWGNPFIIGKDGNRKEVIEKYERWIRRQPQLLEALPELIGLRLGCWCSPEPCHGHVLVRLMQERGIG